MTEELKQLVLEKFKFRLPKYGYANYNALYSADEGNYIKICFSVDLEDPFFEPVKLSNENLFKECLPKGYNEIKKHDLPEGTMIMGCYEEYYWTDTSVAIYERNPVRRHKNYNEFTPHCKPSDFVKDVNGEYIYEGSKVQQMVEKVALEFADEYLKRTGLYLKYEREASDKFKTICEKAGMTTEEYNAARVSQEKSMELCVDLDPAKREIGIRNIEEFIGRNQFVCDKDLEWVLNASETFPELKPLANKIAYQQKVLEVSGKLDQFKKLQYKNLKSYDALTEEEKQQPFVRETIDALAKQGIVERRKPRVYPKIPTVAKLI
ncbi:MAG: hypothetical protein LBM38_02120 [Clostridiales bacterium]|nr:hypothetical protein [Clostridiales bacterium]